MSTKIRTLALLPILSIFLTACTLQDLPLLGRFFGGGTTPANDSATLTMWGLWEDQDVMRILIAKYQESHPNVTINYENRSVIDLKDYKDRVVTRIQEGSLETDIVMIHNSWGPRLAQGLAPAPETLLNVSTYEQQFYPVVTANGVVDNKVVAVPAYYDGLVLVYNKAHFAEIGQDLPPSAWEEFRRLALQLTVRGENNSLLRGGAAIGTADNIEHFSDILGLMWVQADVGFASDLANRKHYNSLEYYGRFVQEIDSDPAADALNFYTNFVREDAVWANEMPEAKVAFIEGKASMIFVPSWQVLDILLSVSDPNMVGVAPVPQAIPEDPRSWASFWMYAVPANSQNAAAAWDFLNFLVNEQTQLKYFEEASKIRVYGPAYSLPSLQDEISSPYLRPVVDSAPYARSLEVASRAGNARQTDALKIAVNAMLATDSPNAKEILTEVKTALGGQ